MVNRIGRRLKYFLLGLFLVWAIAGCETALLTRSPYRLTVQPLPLPALPDWIEQISPTAQAASLAQIRIRFKAPLIPVEALDSPDQQAILQKFEVVPPLPGRFRFLTPRMVGFQADAALPLATRLRVTLKAGLADLKQHQLEQDVAWTFNTSPIQLSLPGPSTEATTYPGQAIEPFDLKPTLEITSNTELDLDSLRQQVKLIPSGQQKSVSLQVALQAATNNESDTSYNTAQTGFDPSQRPWIYTVTPTRNLDRATPYRLEVLPGLRSAHGNVPTDKAFIGQITTYAPLAFQGLQPVGLPDAGGAYGRFVNGSAQLTFNNGLEAESIAENITIAPSAKEIPRLLQAYDGETIVNLNPWALEPATTYTITLGANLKDKFGQTLGKPVSVQYQTGDVAPELWAPSGLNIFPTTKELQLNFSAVNLPDGAYKAAYRVIQPADLVYTNEFQSAGLFPPPNEWAAFPVSGQKNQTVEITTPLREQLGSITGVLAYGVQARANSYQQDGQQLWREPTYYGMVQLTDLGMFAQWFPQSGLIRVHHLTDGSAVTGATIEVYESKLGAASRPQPIPCATGVTDQTGTLVLSGAQLQACLPIGKQSFTEPPQLLAIAREGQDWAFVRTEAWSGDYGYGIYTGWDSDQPQSRGVVFSDRQLYQPGETAWFTGVAFYLQHGSLLQDQNTQYTVTMVTPEGNELNLGQQSTNEFGTFSLQWAIPAKQPLGFYTIRARSQRGVELSGEFRVAEFKPPNFKVDLQLDRDFVRMGETVNAEAQSNYLFGPAVEGGKAEYYVTRERAEWQPQGWEQFAFGRQWFWPEEEPSLPADVSQVIATLDQQGNGKQVIKIAEDLPYPMTYRVDAQITDVSNLSVADSQTFTALPSDQLIGLKSDFVATAGNPFQVEVIVVNPQGEAIANQPVRLELQQMIYSNVTQVIEGSQMARHQVEYKTVATAETRSRHTSQTVSLTPPESGSYRIRANLGKVRNELTATDLQIWATGETGASWADRYDNERLEVKLNQDTYQVGETATVLLQSPYPEAELYFAIVRHNTIYQSITPVKGGAPQIQFQVTPEMLPNAAVEAILVRQGESLEQTDLADVSSLVRIGFAPFTVNLAEQQLQVTATPGSASVLPNEEQTIAFEVKSTQGEPIAAQLTVMVVNEAVLQLTGYRPPNLVDIVYAEQSISTRFADNRPDVVLHPLSSPIDKGWGFGGGFSAGAGNTRIRQNFQPLAYYNGAVLTNATGQATVTFRLPDNLTTWRVIAVAISETEQPTTARSHNQWRFGQGETTFMTTQPLVTQALLPQFVRAGDRFQAGLSVTNNTGSSGTLTVSGTPTGALQLADTPIHLQTQIASGTHAYRFPIMASTTGQGQVQFSSQLNQATDGFSETLEVKPLDITEQVIESGTTATQVQIPLTVAPDIDRQIGGLELALASTLIPEITAPAQQVLEEEQLPFLEPAASQLAIAAALQRFSQIYGQTFDTFQPAAQAAQAWERLSKLQRPDGGFASYPQQQQSDPFVTPYAAQAIASALNAFPTNSSAQFDPEAVNRLKTYLDQLLADPGQYDFCKDPHCKDRVRLETLLALEALGDRRNVFLSDLYQRYSQMDIVAQLKLARYLSLFPEWQQASATLTEQLQETVYQTGRSATVNLPQSWNWLDSPTIAQAQALRLMIARPTSPEVRDRFLQGLLSQRRNGTWGNTYANAEALAALVEYSQLEVNPPNFTAIVELAGKSLINTQFQTYQTPATHLTVPMSDLPAGQHNLTLRKQGQGNLHYLAAYRYRVQGNPAGQFSGLSISRQIRPANQTEVLKQMRLFDTDEPLTVKAGQVFDIGLEIITDHPVDHVIITDPLPAGFEAVDASFQTATPALQAQVDSWQIGYQTIYRDRVVAYGDRLNPGVYTLHYLVRSVTPGAFLYPGAEVHLQYAPEEFGRATASTLKVTD